MRVLRSITLGMILWWATVAVAAGMSSEQEVKIGREAAAEVEREFRIASDRKAQAQIEEIGEKLVAVCARKDIEYHFKILDMGKELNAFALPGGYIYFSESLWKYMTVDQRAAVLAHELAHVTQRHWVRRVDKETKKGIALILLDLILRPNYDIARALGTASDLMSLHYSRDDEREADERGLQYMYLAGYNPWGFVTAMERMRQLAGDFPREVKFLSSHPLTSDRIKAAEARVIRLGVPRPQSKPKITRIPEGEKPVIEVKDFEVTGDYGGKGAETGIADLFAQELARSGQAYATRNGNLVASADRNRVGSIPVDLEKHRHLILKGRAIFNQGGILPDPKGQVTLTVKLVWSLWEAEKEVKQGEINYVRTDVPGTAPSDPWVSDGLYEKGALQFIAGRASLNAVRLALYNKEQSVVSYPDLLPGLPIAKVNARSVVLDAPPDSVSPGDRYVIYKPLGDYISDPQNDAMLERATVKVAVLEITEVSERGIVARAKLEKGYRMRDLKAGDRAVVTQ